jgi:integrator complex subunit 2
LVAPLISILFFSSAELFGKLWFHMNGVFPRKLWTITVNYMNHVVNGHVMMRTMKKITHDDLIIDPLQVLRCDRRVFHCAPMLEIVLYILKACLAASKTMLTQHMQENPIIERSQSSQVTNDMEREELKNALIASQESAAVQILLEAGLTDFESNVREVKLICSYLHESFINDPNLAKLVHFQVY